MKRRDGDVVDEEKKKTLKSVVTGLVMYNELLRERIRRLEDAKPFLGWRPDPIALHRKTVWSGGSFSVIQPVGPVDKPHDVPFWR